MKTSRRGFLGLLGAAVAGTLVPKAKAEPAPIIFDIGGTAGAYDPDGGLYFTGTGPAWYMHPSQMKVARELGFITAGGVNLGAA